MRGGTPTSGLPAVISDGRGKGRRLSTANGNFANLLSFSGATWQNTGCGCEPPDTQMAAGRNEVVEFVNNNIFVYDRGGNQLTAFPATDLFQPPSQTVGLTDPKIVFDPTTNMYYLTMMVCQNGGCGGSSWSHMGISLAVTSDPTGSWTVYDYLNDGQDLQDQEKLGFSGDKITFAVNEYGCKCGSGASYKQENVVVMQKSDAVAGITLNYVVQSYTFNSTPDREFDWMPTTPVNSSTSDNTQYVVWNQEAPSNNDIGVMRITGTPLGGNVDLSNIARIGIANATAPPASNPEPDTAPGSCQDNSTPPNAILCTIAGDKMNFQSATVQGNQLWATGTDGCTPQNDNTNRSCTRLVEVDLGNNSILQDFDVGTQGTYRYNPSVTKDSSDHLYFGFTISSSSIYPTAALDASALPPPSVFGRINFLAGDSTYTGGRWGDYSGTQQDPANTNDIWSAQEYGACSACANFWATAIGQFTFRDPQITSISPNQGPVTGGTSVDIYGSEFEKNGTTVKFGANTSPTVTWFDSTHIRAVSPAGSAGTVDVTATTDTGTSDTSSADHFTYLKIPTTTTFIGPASGDYNDSVTLSARLTNNLNSQGVSGESLSFTMGAESCSGTTNGSGIASCSITPLDVPGPYTVSVSFSGDATYLPSSTSSTFTVNKEESKLTYNGVLTSHYHDTFTASAQLTDPDGGAPIAGKPISFTLGGTQSCGPVVTDLNGNAQCQITPNQTGSKNIVVSFAGDTYYVSSSDTKTFSITPEETTMTYTGPTVILAGASGATLTATLVEDGSKDNDSDPSSPGPNPAETVTLSVGTNNCTGTTDLAGKVTCAIPSVTVPLGPQTVGASFGGDAFYQAASDSTNAIVFAFPSSGVFTLGNLTVAAAGPSTTVTWWSNNWYLLNSLSGGAAPPPFKGFVVSTVLPTTTPAKVCSSLWSTSGGNSPPPPATVPTYMGVIVATKVAKSGNMINGNYVKIVVVKTDPGYAPGPFNSGTGTIVATFCP